jgi:DNA-binding GntR family transcriptional regulator
MSDIPSHGGKAANVKDYKSILRSILDKSPAGTRQRLATALGKNRSFISQLSNPAYAVPVPAPHLQTIFKICDFAPVERHVFLDAYKRAHPNRLKQVRAGAVLRSLNVAVFDFGNLKKNREYDDLVRQAAGRVSSSEGMAPQMDAVSEQASIVPFGDPLVRKSVSDFRLPASPLLTAQKLGDSAHTGSRSNLIYATLKANIVTGALPPGAQIDIDGLCIKFSSSKLPVIKALHRLAYEELVVVKPAHGSFVASIDFDDIRQRMLLRLALETEAIATLTAHDQRQSFLDFARQSLTFQKEALVISDVRSFCELDDDMHRVMISLSGLPKFNDILNGVYPHLGRARLWARATMGGLGATLSEHHAIINAIASGEPTNAVTALREHRNREMVDFQASIGRN